MASVFEKRSPSTGKILHYGKYDVGDRTPEGKIIWKTIPTKQPNRTAAAVWITAYEKAERLRRVAVPIVPTPVRFCGDLLEQWIKGLTNRNAKDDRSRVRLHLLDAFRARDVAKVSTGHVLEWIDEMRAGTAPVAPPPKKARGKRVAKLSDGSMRANLNLLSRFFGWCIERGYAPINPVRQVPTKRRPHQAVKTDVPWLDDDAVVRALLAALPAPFDLMFYLGNRSGLRTGELCGLRMSDLGFLAEGKIRKRFTYDGGPLKEDKYARGISKFVPAPADAVEALGSWLATRTAHGAGPESLVFPRPKGRCKGKAFDKGNLEDAWDTASSALGVTLTWYEATRHSFVSRCLKQGASLDEVSAAVGHSSPVVTQRYYNHFVRDTFSPTLRAGLGIKQSAAPGQLLSLHGAHHGARVQSDSEPRNDESPKPVEVAGS